MSEHDDPREDASPEASSEDRRAYREALRVLRAASPLARAVCPSPQDLAREGLSAERAAARDRHVRACPACREDLRDLAALTALPDQVPYVEVTTTLDANGNSANTITEGQRSPVAIGFSLFLQPHVIPESDRITLTVIPRVNDLVGTTSAIPGFERFVASSGAVNVALDLPRTREQALVTHVMLEDTNTAVLGGLLTETDIEVVKKIPIISSIPIIGPLFTNTEKQRLLENLTIFITPTIIRPSQRASLDSIFMRATRRIERADYFYKKYEKPAAEDAESAEYELEDE